MTNGVLLYSSNYANPHTLVLFGMSTHASEVTFPVVDECYELSGCPRAQMGQHKTKIARTDTFA